MSVVEPTAAASSTAAASAANQLHRRALGVPHLVFFIVAASAPLTAVAGGQQRRSARIAWRRALREMLRLLRDIGLAEDDGTPRRPAMTPQQRLHEAVHELCGEQLAREVFARWLTA